jgi:hypothetical protein
LLLQARSRSPFALAQASEACPTKSQIASACETCCAQASRSEDATWLLRKWSPSFSASLSSSPSSSSGGGNVGGVMRGQPPFAGSSSVNAVTQGSIICSFDMPAQNNAPLFPQLSLCLCRACLGNIIRYKNVSSIKMAQGEAFSAPGVGGSTVTSPITLCS